ncbi:MAG: undecaprenyl-diphosphatase UppP [Caldilineaceae bacterium]|nr:undecaprenyl-diphosphatase UppP [Caldilineaceae bacterium]
MFELIQAIVLGLVQGATEFIPVSSSGHLVIVPWLLGWEKPSLLFDTVLHWGTLLAIALIFWRDFLNIIVASLRSIGERSLVDPNARLGWYIVAGSIPAALTGLLLKDQIEDLFASPTAAGAFLLVTAALLIGSEQLARQHHRRKTTDMLTWTDAIVIGLAQAIALAPGISRSGSTIAAGLARGVRREDAARFSFLLGTPAFLGAGLLALGDALASDPAVVAAQLPMLLVGFVFSALSGFVAIRFLLAYLRNRTLYVFAVYCILMAIVVLTLSFFGF